MKTALLRLVVAAGAAALEDVSSSLQVSSADTLEDAGVGSTVIVVAFAAGLVVGITKLEMRSVGTLLVATGDTALAGELDADELTHALQASVSLLYWRRPYWLACVRVARAATRASLVYMLTEVGYFACVGLYRCVLSTS